MGPTEFQNTEGIGPSSHPPQAQETCIVTASTDNADLTGKSFSGRVRDILFRELFLAPDPKIAAAVTDDKDISLTETIKGAADLLWKHAPQILLGRTGLALSAASVPLVWSWLSGNVVGSFSSLVPNLSKADPNAQVVVVWGVEPAILLVGIFALAADLPARIGNWFYSWEDKTIARLSKQLAFNVTNTWTYEGLEDSKKQLAYERFKEHSGKLFGIFQHSIEAASATIMSCAAACLLWPLDWRLSCAGLAFMGVRVFRDLRESKTSFAIEKSSAEERRFLSVDNELSADPRRSRDMRLIEQTTSLQERYQEGTRKIHDGVLADEKRVQLIRLCYDLIPAVIQLTSVALIFKGVSSAGISVKDGVAYIGFSFNLVYQCRGVGYQIGKVLQAKTFAAECLEFLRSAHEERGVKPKMSERANPPTIKLTGVKVIKHDKCILEVPDLVIQPGQIIGIVGKEGAGKSTFVKALLGLRDLSEGSVSFAWSDASCSLSEIALASFHRLVACNNQDFLIPEGKSVQQILDLGEAQEISLETLNYDEALALTGADEFISHHPTGKHTIVGAGWATKDDNGNETESVAFSQGQRKLIGLATTLRTRKPIIVLDEPSSGVSPETSRRFLERICGAAKERGATVLIVSHHFENFSFADRILSIEGGRIVQDGTPDELSRQPGAFQDGVTQTANQTLRLLGLELVSNAGDYSIRSSKPDGETSVQS